MRIAAWVAWVVFLAELLMLFWLVWLYTRHGFVITFEKGADVATLALTAATLVVAFLGVIGGVAAVWGFREIRDQAVRAAVSAAQKAVAGEQRAAFEQGRDAPAGDAANRIADAMEGADEGGEDGGEQQQPPV